MALLIWETTNQMSVALFEKCKINGCGLINLRNNKSNKCGLIWETNQMGVALLTWETTNQINVALLIWETNQMGVALFH